ncbi:MAG: TM0106 family RecB-like putative nuclease, partial [Acidobacteria bacterium]|nr:TM0106 family RecB-like putative nuclease [Acidobacteriota bacterium]
MFFNKPLNALQLSATDLASFLGCHHRTALEMGHAFGTRQRPEYDDPSLESLFARGLDHEKAYVDRLIAEGRHVHRVEKGATRDETLARTRDAMAAGAGVIVQGALGNARWFGYADVLLKVGRPGAFGPWSYEVVDTKLSRETKAGTVLQLALYSTLLEDAQGARPEQFYVVTPDATEPYRLNDYAAYFRLIRARLDQAATENDEQLAAAHYPEPVDHCDICPWTGQCSVQRRKDDHLSLVAGISRTQRRELVAHEIAKTAALAAMPIRPMTFTPRRGAAETYERVREQARVQVEARTTGALVVEMLDIVRPSEQEPGQGLCRLPEPNVGDIFLDLEGDPFVGPTSGPPMLRGREYLFGVVANGAYRAFWASTADDERRAFEAVVDLIIAAQATHPGMHVYHYAPYEPSAFKRLMGRHATREIEIDSLLRSDTFVDLYAIVRQSLRAGVERYSIKNLEAFYGFTRDVDLRAARLNLQAMELAVEQNRVADLKPEVTAAVEGYNRDDCMSTWRLRDWLESKRTEMMAGGADIPRPVLQPGEASPALTDQQQKVATMRGQLLGSEDPARALLAYLLDYHRREQKAEWWEYFRIIELTDEELLDESGAVSGL